MGTLTTQRAVIPTNSKKVDSFQLDFHHKKIASNGVHFAPNVLLIEDDPIVQHIHNKILQQCGCRVDIASSGNEACNLLNNPHDLILLDIGLPDMNGLQLAGIIKKQEQHKNIPIIAVTSQQKTIKNSCYAAGISAVFPKPLSFEQFSLMLQYWLETVKY